MGIDPTSVGVIIVEDNQDTLFLASDILSSMVRIRREYIKSGASGEQIFRDIEEGSIVPEETHVIFLDIQIPRENGFEILKRIRQIPGFTSTKVIAFTANVMPQDEQGAREAGFDGFVGKPIRDKKFADQARRILAGESVWEPR